jgi:hypothetical protein
MVLFLEFVGVELARILIFSPVNVMLTGEVDVNASFKSER